MPPYEKTANPMILDEKFEFLIHCKVSENQKEIALPHMARDAFDAFERVRLVGLSLDKFID